MKFSITIPAYKTRFLRECIDSVLAQTYTDFEVIILNDASPEDVDGIVHSFTDNRIRYYKNEQNVGAVNLVDNWNKCLELAKGEYIICMGDDDRLMPDCLEQYVNMIEKYPHVDLFHARTVRIDASSTPIGVSQGYVEHEGVFSFMLHRLNNGTQYIGDFCYRISHLRAIGGYYFLSLAWGADDITAYMASVDSGLVNLPMPTFCYRVSTLTISQTGNIEQKLCCLKSRLQWIRNFVESHTPADLVEELSQKELLSRFNSYIKKETAFQLASGTGYRLYSLLKWIILHKRKHKDVSLAALALAVVFCLRKS